MSIVDDINAISDRVFALEQENDRLKAQPQQSEAVTTLLDLLQEHIEWQEAHGRWQTIVAAYRAVRPKEG